MLHGLLYNFINLFILNTFHIISMDWLFQCSIIAISSKTRSGCDLKLADDALSLSELYFISQKEIIDILRY